MIYNASLGRRALLLVGGGAALSGCSLLKAPEPVPLYRFGQSTTPGVAATSTAAGVTVLFSGTTFPRAAAGDRILTSTGVEVSYLAASRWASPAVNLFDEAVLRGFAGSPVRLLGRGSSARADGVMRVEVRTFEARYATADSAPTVVVEARGLIAPSSAAGVVLDRTFSAQRPASVNRVSAIAESFDSATAEVIGALVAWAAGAIRPAS